MTLRTRIYFFIAIFLCIGTSSFAQKIIRSSLSSFGNAVHDDGTIYRQTIGQPSNTSAFYNDKITLQQGFQQPIFQFNSNTKKSKACTLHLNPNPTEGVFKITFSEDIGEHLITIFDMMGKMHFKIQTAGSVYEMDASKLPKGVYIVNVVSESGYYCNQKLIVL